MFDANHFPYQLTQSHILNTHNCLHVEQIAFCFGEIENVTIFQMIFRLLKCVQVHMGSISSLRTILK